MQTDKDTPKDGSAPNHDIDQTETPSAQIGKGQKRSLDSTTSTCSTPVGTMTGSDVKPPSTSQSTNIGEKKQKQNDTEESENIVDIAQTLDLKPGDRIEVQWDLHFDEPSTAAPVDTVSRKQTRWWGGILLHPDSRTRTLQDDNDHEHGHDQSQSQIKDEVTVPIRVIDYDPYLEGGFPERSLEDVCFLSDHSLLNVASETRAYWRKEGEVWEPALDTDAEERVLMEGLPPSVSADQMNANGNLSDDEISVASTSKEDALKVVLDTVLMNAMNKAGIMGKMTQLEASQQSLMAEKIAGAKEMLTQKLMEQLNNTNGNSISESGVDDSTPSQGGNNDTTGNVITKEHVAKCVQEFKKDAA
jgi:hypothetical protein